ncbi:MULTISPECIES: carboxymuconolactone decarboxylase family protein [unclassified Crossiella]|uniref:carboxymuconolactone decarboxylase family protein n=1 Tax=unclassified Crossiella TaxID=2620835 RepID=UPI001FFF2B68|nr:MULTISPECIES: carboxymuconolactone decarboxylase family protein [unclassified Crossiella]MCK2244698.1 carboxymuconolactone decarboxylase family protein [Crossiella sp. S99.2]MCK2258315.1 carboxymuconolactone decarboxylase family protein [Crossiella sp. S99.1]
MTQRIQLSPGIPSAYQALIDINNQVAEAGRAAGLDPKLLELVKIRASQLNGCAFCIDLHTKETLKAGESQRRIFLLNAWRETQLYTDQERVALELTEEVTRLAETRDVPDELYQRATELLTPDQYKAVMWMIVVINAFNRLAVPSHAKLPHA